MPLGFEDISATGTQFLPSADDANLNIPLPVSFNFYGPSYNSVFASTNGLLTFGAGNSGFTNEPLTGPIANRPTIAVLWDDWITSGNGVDAMYHRTLGAAGARRFVVQWNLVRHFSSLSPSTVTFQAVLHEGSNNIELRYLDTDTGNIATASGASATVGLRDVSGHLNGKNLQWSHNQAVIPSGSAILFTPNLPPDCSTARPSVATLWPPDHTLREITIGGVADPEGDSVTVSVTGVSQDEPLNGLGDGDTSPDAVAGSSSDQVQLRAERSGTGDGRVDAVSFSASDGKGGSCTATSLVTVLRSQGKGSAAVDSGQTVNSFGP